MKIIRILLAAIVYENVIRAFEFDLMQRYRASVGSHTVFCRISARIRIRAAEQIVERTVFLHDEHDVLDLAAGASQTWIARKRRTRERSLTARTKSRCDK
jgi:hypothetical protein